MNGFAALDIPPCWRYVVVKATAGFAVCRLILKLLLFYSCLDFTQNLGKTRNRDCRAALRKLVSSVYLESDLNLPFGKNGKFLFQLGYTPVVSDMKKVVQKTAALSFPKWALAVWDMDTATLYMVKYDRSH